MNCPTKRTKAMLCLFLVIIMVFSNSSLAFAEGLEVVINLLKQMVEWQAHDHMRAAGYAQEDYQVVIDEDGKTQIFIKEGAVPTFQANTAASSNTPAQNYANEFEASYYKGIQLEEQGDYIGAVDAFIASDGYADAVQRIGAHIEEYAREMMDDGEYHKAQKALLLCNDPAHSELLAQCNDKCFLADMVRGLDLRSENSNKGIDRGVLVGYELDCIEKYMDAVFFDKTLEKYAKIYITALHDQLTGYGYIRSDTDKYDFYWNGGLLTRRHMIYLIDTEFGLPDEDKSNLRTHLAEGKVVAETTSVDSYDYPGKGEENASASAFLQPSEGSYSNKFEAAYYEGMRLEEAGDWVGSIEAFVASEGYADAAVHAAAHLEEYAREKIAAEEYRKAQAALLLCKDPKLNDLLAQCSDQCFLLDIADGLSVRWTNSERDTSTMGGKKVREYYRSLVSDELDYIGKYMNLPFADKDLAELAFAYIGALQNQYAGAEYYGKDDELFTEYWTENGQKARQRIIFLLNKKYGIEIDNIHQTAFADCISAGEFQDEVLSVQHMLREQLVNVDWEFGFGADGKWLMCKNDFQIHNTCGYKLESLLVHIKLFDQRGDVVNSSSIGLITKLEKNKIGTAGGHSLLLNSEDYKGTLPAFSRFELLCEYVVCRDYERYKYSVTLVPMKQWSWDGKTLKSNDFTENESIYKPSFAVEEVHTLWDTNASSSKELYVPRLQFALRNTGNAEATSVEVKCVFIDPETKIEWDEVHTYIVSSSTTTLKSGYARTVDIYSNRGYTKRISDVPELVAEIYVNDEPMGTYEIKP